MVDQSFVLLMASGDVDMIHTLNIKPSSTQLCNNNDFTTVTQ